ncbi:MAG: anaerobic ribonucleoside-triphosphate reductase activating protein [Oscillospiraceae bacterium]|nr:anaerobic ribonucleoside-triphosphate reductase activating protein [Oscillospiraceae bacterium]
MISGLQKMTLLDYPGKVACTIFTQGCNFRCPFCHNSDLLGSEGPETIEIETLMAFLRKRVGLLDAVCITGGEPTLQPGLEDLIVKIKALGYLVKLDTNGSRPEVLKALVEKNLLDYVAMDIKNSPEKYGATAGVPNMHLDKIEESIQYLLAGNVAYEFRTTVMDELHEPEDFEAIGKWLRKLDPDHKAAAFFIQPYVDRDSVLTSGLHTPTREKLGLMLESIAPHTSSAKIRGLD